MSGPPDNAGFDPNFINSFLPDGTVLRFPKGTDPAIVDQMFKEQLALHAQPKEASPPQVGTGEAAGIGATQGLTLDFGDEMASGIAATVGRPGGEAIPGQSWGERYDNALEIARPRLRAAEKQHPVAFGAGKVAGAIAPALIAPEAFGSSYVASAPSMGSAAARGALTSGAYGAVTGFGSGEGGPGGRIASTGTGAALGAATGAVVAPVARGISGLISPAPKAPTGAAVKDAATAAYKASDDAGVVVTPDALKRLGDTMKSDLADWGYLPKLQPQISAVLDEVDRLGGDNATLKSVELLRRVAGRIFNPQNPSEAEAASRLVDHIDDFMDDLKPTDLVMGDATAAVQALKDARANWSVFRKSQLLEDAISTAKDRAAVSGTGGNVVNTIRQNLMKIANSPKLSRGFSKDELDAIRKVARGGPIENLARMASAFAPSRGGLNAWMAMLAQAIPGVGQAIPVLGEAANVGARRMTQSAAERLPEMVRSGAVVPGAVAAPSYPEALARTLGAALPGSNVGMNAYARALLQPTGAPR